MKKGLVNGLRVFRGLILHAVFGEVTKLPTEPKVVGSVVHPENQPSLNQWLVEFKVGIALPKRVIVTKQQIAKKFRVNTNELVII